MAVINISMSIELDDKIAEKIVDILTKTTEKEVPEGIEVELRDVGGRLSVRVVQTKKP